MKLKSNKFLKLKSLKKIITLELKSFCAVKVLPQMPSYTYTHLNMI